MGFRSVEYLVDCPRNESHLVRWLVGIKSSAHCMRFARASLAVRENRHVVALHQFQHHRFDRVHIDHLLRFVSRKCIVERELVLVVDHYLRGISRLRHDASASECHF